MKPSLTKRAINRQRWRERISAWKSSNRSQKAFCEEHQLGLASFRRWHRLLQAEDAKGIPTDRAPVSFLPVRVREAVPLKLTVLVHDNLRVEVPAGFDPNLFREVIEVLRAT